MKGRLAGSWLARYPVAAVSLGLSLLFGLGIVWRGPLVEAAEERLIEFEREWRQIQLNGERAVGLEADIMALEGALEALEQRVIDPEEVALNYEFFLRTERLSGVSLDAFSQDPLPSEAWKLEEERALDLYRAVPFTLEIVGDYAQIVDYVRYLEDRETLTRTGFIAIDRVKDKAGSIRLKAKIVCHQLGKKDD